MDPNADDPHNALAKNPRVGSFYANSAGPRGHPTSLRRTTLGRLRICSVLASLAHGGGTNRVLAFARSVDRSRFDHLVVVCYAPEDRYDARWGSIRREYQDAGVELVELGITPRQRLLASSAETLVGAVTAARVVKRLATLVRERRIDLLDAQHGTVAALSVPVARATGCAVTVTEYHPWERVGTRTLGRMILGASNAVICDSRVRAEEINAWLFSPHRHMAVIPNGISRPEPARTRAAMLDHFRLPDAGAPIIAQVSRLVPYKGHQVLMRSAQRVLKAFPDAYFLCVGYAGANPRYLTALEREAASLGVADRFRIGGYDGSIGDVWQLVDYHVHASRYDSLPIAITEAMAWGRPSVVTRVGGIPEMVTHEETGMLVEADDAAALGDALVRVMSDNTLSTRLGASARARYAMGYRPEVMTRALERLFEEVVAA